MCLIKKMSAKILKQCVTAAFWQIEGKGKKCSIMSDKVFFLRFKDHCATLNMFVTLALTGAIWSFTRTLSAQYRGEERSPFPFISARFPSKPTNKLQCTFDTNWFLNSNNNVVLPVRPCVTHSRAWVKGSICLCDRNRPDASHQGMLITPAWPGPLWPSRDKENQPRPVKRRRGLIGVCSNKLHRPRSHHPISCSKWEENKIRLLRLRCQWLWWSQSERKPHWISWTDLISCWRNEILAGAVEFLTAEQVNKVGRQATG